MHAAKRIVQAWLGAAFLAAVILAGTAEHAHAAPATPASVQALDATTDPDRLLRLWSQFNGTCRGEPYLRRNINVQNPACIARDRITEGLTAQGWILANHDVWYSRTLDSEVWFVVQSLNQERYTNTPALVALSIASDHLLKTGISGPQLIAVWNANSDYFRTHYPFGWRMLDQLMHDIVAASPNDPRYTLDEDQQ